MGSDSERSSSPSGRDSTKKHRKNALSRNSNIESESFLSSSSEERLEQEEERRQMEEKNKHKSKTVKVKNLQN